MVEQSDAPVRVHEFSMAALVDRTGVPAATIRYYLAEGLLPTPRRAAPNRFLYDDRHVEVIRLIRLLQERRNLSLETIGRLLPDLLPDLTGGPEGGVFRPEMWGRLLAVHFPAAPSPSAADRLLDAGLIAFSHHGYSDVSVDDVCRIAAIAKGSFYRYYPSKEELFYAVASAVGARVASCLATVASEGAVAPDRAGDLLAECLLPHLAVLLDLSSLAAQRRPGYGRVLRSLMAVLGDAVGKIVREPDGREAPERHRELEEVVDLGIARAIRAGTIRVAVVPALDDLRGGERTG